MTKEKRQYKDRAAYLIQAVKQRRHKLKLLALEYKGGKCELCGYKREVSALEFHHKDPQQKDFALSTRGLTRSWNKIQRELDKCVLVCANCHRELHSGLMQLPNES
jgi:hypothetical protein